MFSSIKYFFAFKQRNLDKQYLLSYYKIEQRLAAEWAEAQLNKLTNQVARVQAILENIERQAIVFQTEMAGWRHKCHSEASLLASQVISLEDDCKAITVAAESLKSTVAVYEADLGKHKEDTIAKLNCSNLSVFASSAHT